MALILAYQGHDSVVVATDLRKGGWERLVKSDFGNHYFAWAGNTPPMMEQLTHVLSLEKLVGSGNIPNFGVVPALMAYADSQLIVLDPKKPQLYSRNGESLDIVKVEENMAVFLFSIGYKFELMEREHSFKGRNPEEIADKLIESIGDLSYIFDRDNGCAAYISRAGRVVPYAKLTHVADLHSS